MRRIPILAGLCLSLAPAFAQRTTLAAPETFGALGGTQELRVTAPPKVAWKVRDRPGISVGTPPRVFFQFGEVTSGKGNGTIKVVVPPNTENAGRTGAIGIEFMQPADAGGNFSSSHSSVTVKQLAFTAAPASLNFTAAGGTRSVAITADSDWQVTASSDFLTVTPRSGSAGTTLSITCPPFPARLPVRFRAGSVTLANGSLSRTVAIQQSR